jgi:hypothetical protein
MALYLSTVSPQSFYGSMTYLPERIVTQKDPKKNDKPFNQGDDRKNKITRYGHLLMLPRNVIKEKSLPVILWLRDQDLEIPIIMEFNSRSTRIWSQCDIRHAIPLRGDCYLQLHDTGVLSKDMAQDIMEWLKKLEKEERLAKTSIFKVPDDDPCFQDD